MLSRELEDWLTEIGDQIVQKKAARGYAALSSREQVVYEVWLFDTETRNGGVSQYFCNRGLERWSALVGLARIFALPRLLESVEKVNAVVGDSDDPYRTVLEANVKLDTAFEQRQTEIVAELRAFAEPRDE